MRKMISLAVAVSMVVVLGQIGLASSFKILGTRPLGMGGAFVAVAEDAIAQYWNPAGFALQKGLDIQIPIGVGIETTEGLIDEVDDLGDMAETVGDIMDRQESGTGFTPELIQEFTSAINDLDDLNKAGLGLILDINAGLNIRYRNIGIGVINITELGADPSLDLINIGLGVSTGPVTDALDAFRVDIGGSGAGDVEGLLSPAQGDIATNIANSLDVLGVAPTPGPENWDNQKIAEELVVAGVLAGLTNDEIEAVASAIVEGLELWGPLAGAGFSDNETNIRLNGIMLFEAPITYARELPWLKNLYVGGNFKFMYGMVGFAQFDVFSGEDLMGGLYEDYNDNTKASTTIGADVGALYDLKENWKVRFGMVVRNLTYPSFTQPKEAKDKAGLDKYVIEPQVRVGAAYWPLNFITLSADWDLTNNKTALQGYYSKMLSLGAEVNIFNRSWLNFALRGGFMDNLAESSGSMFTAGLGLNIFHFQLDFAAAMSTKSTTIADSQKFPTALTGSLGISVNF